MLDVWNCWNESLSSGRVTLHLSTTIARLSEEDDSFTKLGELEAFFWCERRRFCWR